MYQNDFVKSNNCNDLRVPIQAFVGEYQNDVYHPTRDIAKRPCGGTQQPAEIISCIEEEEKQVGDPRQHPVRDTMIEILPFLEDEEPLLDLEALVEFMGIILMSENLAVNTNKTIRPWQSHGVIRVVGVTINSKPGRHQSTSSPHQQN